MTIFMKVNTAAHYEIATTRMRCIVCFLRVAGAFLTINKYQFIHIHILRVCIGEGASDLFYT